MYTDFVVQSVRRDLSLYINCFIISRYYSCRQWYMAKNTVKRKVSILNKKFCVIKTSTNIGDFFFPFSERNYLYMYIHIYICFVS